MTTQRWNDEMLDRLATSVFTLHASVGELREELRTSVGELREELRTSVGELRESIEELRESVEELRENQSAILIAFAEEREEARQQRIEYKQWKQETDQRFNILLEEVRASNRRIDRLESQS